MMSARTAQIAREIEKADKIIREPSLSRKDMLGADEWFPSKGFALNINNALRYVTNMDDVREAHKRSGRALCNVTVFKEWRIKVRYRTYSGEGYLWEPWKTPEDVVLTSHADLDDLVAKRTAFKTFLDLVNAKGGYRPTIIPRDFWDWVLINEYNKFQWKRNDPRRVHAPSRRKRPKRFLQYQYWNQEKKIGGRA